MAEWIGKATAPVARCVNLVSEESLFKDFADGLKEKVETSSNVQVSEGELIPVEQSEWAAPIVERWGH